MIIVGDVVAQYLAIIFNNHIKQGTSLHQLIIATIALVFKSGSQLLPTNYRPISVLSSFAKMFEKCIT